MEYPALGLLLLIVALISLFDSDLESPALMYGGGGGASVGVGLVVSIIGSRYGTSAFTILSPKKMTNHATWLEGVSQEYVPPEMAQIRR